MRNTTRPLLNFALATASVTLVFLLIFGTSVCAAASKKSSPNPVATAQISEWVQPVAGKAIHSTLTFLSGDTIALLLCEDAATNCRLVILQISNGRINMVAHKDIGQLPYDQTTIDGLNRMNYTDEQKADLAARIKNGTRYGLYRYGAGFVLKPCDFYFYLPTVQWYSQDLSVSHQIPYPDLISHSGGTIASRVRKVEPYLTWTISRVSSSVPPMVEDVRVVSHLLALSDEQVAVAVLTKLNPSMGGKADGRVTVQVESLDGHVLDSVKGLGETVYNIDPSIPWEREYFGSPVVGMEFANGGRLYLPGLPGSRPDVIADFQGTRLIHWQSPGQWRLDDRLGWAADGTRLLYDRYTQKSSLPRRIAEDAVIAASVPLIIASQGGNALPFPANNNNEELVRVLDPASGKTCFDWIGQKNDIDNARQYHADISPDGKSVAVLTPSALALYALPASCAKR